MTDVFLSYHSRDRERVRMIAEALEAERLSVWWDPAVRAGETYDEVIENNLREAAVVVGLWSPRAARSRWVRAECTIGDRRGALAPAMIEPCDRPVAFELLQTADLTRWSGDRRDPTWRAFVEDIRARLSAARAKAGAEPPEALESLFWASIKDSTEAEDFRLYLKRYPKGHFADIARARVKAARAFPLRASVWAIPMAAGAAVVLAVFVYLFTREHDRAAASSFSAPIVDAPPVAEPAPRSEMEAFAAAPGFLPADTVMGAALDGAVLCADYEAADNTCAATSHIRRAGADYEEVERMRLAVSGRTADVEAVSRFRIEAGFACYDEPGATALRITRGALPNQDAALAAMRAAMRERAAPYARICVGVEGAPDAMRFAGFDEAGARIRDPERWNRVITLTSTQPTLRAQRP